MYRCIFPLRREIMVEAKYEKVHYPAFMVFTLLRWLNQFLDFFALARFV